MLKKTLNLKGVRTLSNAEQKEVKGGFWGGECAAQLVDCSSDNDCPCGRRCVITMDTPQGPIDLCEFM